MQEQIAKGKVVHKEGKYFLDVAGKMEVIPVGLLGDEEVLKKLAGQEVEIFYTIPKKTVVGIQNTLNHITHVCNIPRIDYIGTGITNPSSEMMRKVADKLLKQGDITKEVHDKMLQGIG